MHFHTGRAAGRPSAEDSSMSNQRRSPRHRVHEFGKIIFSNGKNIVACVIVDASQDGARLMVDTGAAKNASEIPDTFILHHKKAGAFYNAKVVRRTDRTIAVRLLSSLDQSEIDHERVAAVIG
jgi:hypothetical protein